MYFLFDINLKNPQQVEITKINFDLHLPFIAIPENKLDSFKILKLSSSREVKNFLVRHRYKTV